METSTRITAECYNESVVSLLEQYLNACREALDTLKTELTKYLGQHAVSTINDHLSSSPSPPFPPPLLEPEIARRSKPELVEKIKRVDVQVKQVTIEMRQMGKVIDHVTWMWGWACHSPLRDYFGQIIVLFECFVSKRENAVKSFRTSWEILKVKRARTNSADTSATSVSQDDWLLTIQEFQHLNLIE